MGLSLQMMSGGSQRLRLCSNLLCSYYTIHDAPIFSHYQVLQGKADWKKLKHGWPHYMPQLEQMFEGVAVDGSTAYVPSANEEFEEEEEPSLNVQTPVSSNSNKRASTASTCASSPNKKSKSKSQAIKLMDKVISEQTRIGEDKNKMMDGWDGNWPAGVAKGKRGPGWRA